jgi:purine-nucleoside phosphorylase
VDAAEAEGAIHHVGPICTVDVFYNPDADYVGRWAARGVIALEMETSAVFFLAARARAAGADVRAASILTVSDVLGEGRTSEDTYLPLDELERRTAAALRVALAAATSPAVTAGL